MSCMLASSIAQPYIDEIQKTLSTRNLNPKLVGFLANSDPSAQQYADWTARTATSLGFIFELRKVDKDQIEECLVQANADPRVHGIMIYFPIFGAGQDQYLQQVVCPSKDVEGLSHKYLQNLYHNVRFLDAQKTRKSILPCTPLAVVKTLESLQLYDTSRSYGNRLEGKTVAIVNRSEIVGRPLAALLANDGAVVYSIDINGIQKFTRGESLRLKSHQVLDMPPECTVHTVAPLCDVVITGVPRADYKFPHELLKPGVACINFASERNFDPQVKGKASIYVPSMGKVTIAMLLRNLVRLVENQAC